MKSYYERTGKLQPKLDAYLVFDSTECFRTEIYLFSSNWHKTQKEFKESIYAEYPEYKGTQIKIRKGR